MSNTAALHPAFQFEDAPQLRLLTADEMEQVDGGSVVSSVKWGAKIGFLVGGVVGGAIGAAIAGGIWYAVTH